jgi:hypothetical protein
VPLTRTAATIVAISAWLGLILPFIDARQMGRTNALATLWAMLAYFTILTNLLAAIAFTALALGHPVAPWLLGGILLAIVLVAVIFALLLRDTPIGTTRAAILATTLLHTVTPALVTLFWIACAPKGTLHWIDAALWTAYPLAYLGYSLLRANATGFYPYPFLHVPQIGWPATIRNAAAIALAFIVASLILIGLDHLAAAR